MYFAIGGAVLGVILLVILIMVRRAKIKAGLPVFHILKNKVGGSHWYIVLIFLTALLVKCGSNPSPVPQPVPAPTPIPSPQPQYAHARGFIKQPGQGLHVGAPFILADRVGELPVRFSWVPTYSLPVEDQGQAGTCWSFSTVENLEYASALFLDKPIKLSEQFMVGYGGCGSTGGGNFCGSLEVSQGLPLEKDCPYQADNSSCGNVPIALKAVKEVNIGTGGQSPTIEQLKSALMEFGPLSVSAAAGGDWDGLGPNDIIDGNSSNVNHMILLLSWDDAKGAWEFQNSWGNWHGNGRAWIKYGADSFGSDAATVLVKPVAEYKKILESKIHP